MLPVSEVWPPQKPLHRSGDLWSLQQQTAPYCPFVLPGTRKGTKPPPAAQTVEDPIMLGMIDVPTDFSPPPIKHNPPPSNYTSQQNPNPSRHAIPELPSPPTPPQAPKPQRPPKPPPKAKRSPTHTPSPLRFTSPTNPPTATQPKKPTSSSSAPVTHTPIPFHSLKEFPNLPSSTVTSKPSASRPSKCPPIIDSSEYDLSACPMDALLAAAISNILCNFLRSRKIKFTQESLDDFVFDNTAWELRSQFPS
ncbi:uncharacterized protein [Palaemon carinicauda]|uniref:uncharacterized protein n=1 Tax=Palaemon carinicauda TaxID=392227 RepID=UPI0035B69F60